MSQGIDKFKCHDWQLRTFFSHRRSPKATDPALDDTQPYSVNNA